MKSVRRRTAMLFIIACLTMMLSATTAFARGPYMKSKTVIVNQTITLKVMSRGANAVRNWKSSKPSVVRVNQHGKIRGLRPGKATISVMVGSKKVKCTVKVKAIKVKAIKLSRTQAKLQLGKTLRLAAKIAPANASIKTVKWKSSNTKIAVVTSKGEVIPKKIGTVTISATSKGGNKKVGKCKVTIVKKDPFVSITDVLVDVDKTMVTAGQTAQATVKIYPDNATSKKVIWSSSNTSVATVDQTGKIKGVRQGVVTIKAEAADGSGEWDAAQISVIADVLKPYREGLAAAKKQGPAAVIKYCEQNRDMINIGRYANRGLGMVGINSDMLNAETDYGNALSALYKPWLKQVFNRSLANRTGDKYEQVLLLNAYICSMYTGHMVYANRTVGWGLCPAVAPLLREGMLTHLDGVPGHPVKKSYLGGNCTAIANLLIDVLNEMNFGYHAELIAYMGDFHVGVLVVIGQNKYVFDPQTGGTYVLNASGVSPYHDNQRETDAWQIINTYGPIDYTP